MIDPLTTVAAVVSFVDVTIRACKEIHAVIDTWKDAPNTVKRLRKSVQNQESLLRTLRLYALEYESSKLSIEQHQLLPVGLNDEFHDISFDLDLLQNSLPSAGSERRLRRRFRWVFDEKKTLEISNRLDRRQVTVMASLQVTAQRNGVKVFEQTSNIRGDMQQNQAATEGQLRRIESSLNQIGEAARDESKKLSEQAVLLRSIQTLVEPVADNHAKTIDRMNDLVTAMRLSSGQQRSNTFLETSSIDTFGRVIRAELKGLVMPTIEEFLDSYKSSQGAQLKGISHTLDEIASMLGQQSLNKNVKIGHEPTVNILESNSRKKTFPYNGSFNDPWDQSFDVIESNIRSYHNHSERWIQSWSRTWTFRWRIGVLVVHISAFHIRPSIRRNKVQAFEQFVTSSARYAYRILIEFRAAPSLLVARGITLGCESKQDQRGYYQIHPSISTYAVVPRKAKVFNCVMHNDVAGLQRLFKDRLAAPTDRNNAHFSLLHVASACGYAGMCEYLLTEGADPFAISNLNHSPLLLASFGAFVHSDGEKSGISDFNLVVRNLISSGCDLNEIFENYSSRTVGPVIRINDAQQLRQRIVLEHPPSALIRWVEVLRDQGLNMQHTDDNGLTPLMYEILQLYGDYHHRREPMSTVIYTIFTLCLLGADVSVREPRHGAQVLHLLFNLERSSVESEDFVALAIILVLHGKADVFATTYSGHSPTTLAYQYGWEDEWKVALDTCGLDPEEIIAQDFEQWKRTTRFGPGDSSAIDIEELGPADFDTVTKRRNVTRDRLVD